MIKKAMEFAMSAHEGQVRKYSGEPYIIHPANVAYILSEIYCDDNMIAAAWLHDTVEDTHVTISDIYREFGDDIANLVDDLTDISKPEDGNRSVRKQKELEHTACASERAKTIKLADLIDNTDSILEDPEFAKIYMAEKRELLKVLVKGDKYLYDKAKQIVDDYYG